MPPVPGHPEIEVLLTFDGSWEQVLHTAASWTRMPIKVVHRLACVCDSILPTSVHEGTIHHFPDASVVIRRETGFLSAGRVGKRMATGWLALKLNLKWPGRILLVIVATGLTLPIAEYLLQRTESRQSYFVTSPGLHRIFKPMPGIMPGVEGESQFLINAYGLRGSSPSPGHDFRILCVGGSTTECMILDEKHTWPELLGGMLSTMPGERRSIWVGNAGKSGCNSRHNLLHVEKLLDQIPGIDMVILLLGVNDLGFRLAADASYAPWNQDRRDTDIQVLEKAFDVFPPPGREETETSLFALQTLRHKIARMVDAFNPPPQLQAQVQDDAGRSYNHWRRSRQRAVKAGRIRTTLPDLDSSLREYERNIRLIIAAARNRRVDCVFLTQPVLWREDLPPDMESLLWMGGVGNFRFEKKCEYYSTEALKDGMDLYNQKLREVCKAESVTCIDLAGVIEKDMSLFYDGCHFNQRGAARVAEEVFKGLPDLRRRQGLRGTAQ